MSQIRRKDNEVLGAPVYLRDEVNRLFDNFFGPVPFGALRDAGERSTFLPALDISETPQAVSLTMEIPGVKPENLEVNLTGNILTLRGQKREETEEGARNWHRVERSYGSFTRTIQLPETVDPDKVRAVTEHGVLKLEIGKTQAAKPRSIKVEIKG